MMETQSLATFDALLADVTLAVKPMYAIEVKDPATELAAKSAGGQVMGLLKDVERRRKELIAPLKAQIDAIDNAAKKVKSVLSEPETYLRRQLDSYASEIARQQAEARRIQAEKEAAERRAADERRRKEEAEIRARQESERKEREAAAQAERQRIADEAEAKRQQAEEAAAVKAKAASLFGGGRDAVEWAERLAKQAWRKAEQEAADAQKAADQRAADEARAMADRQERERLAESARLERQIGEREAALEAERQAIEAQRVKGAKPEISVQVVDAWAVPREFLRTPEVQIAEVKKAYKAGLREIPGLLIREGTKVSLRAEVMPANGFRGSPAPVTGSA